MANFTPGEKILCFHGPLIYEAKCLQHRTNAAKETEYLIHYQRWSKKWDEWVPEERMLKFTDENLKKQAELEESQKGTRGKPQRATKKGNKDAVKGEDDIESRSSTPNGDVKTPRARPKKRTKTPVPSEPADSKVFSVNTSIVNKDDTLVAEPEISMEVEEEKHSSPPPVSPIPRKKPRINIKATDIDFKMDSPLSNPHNIKLLLPRVLTKWLIEDWAQISQDNPRLLNLPAEITVSAILHDYETYRLLINPYNEHDMIRREIAKIEDLFNKSLVGYLLHKWEMVQFQDLTNQYRDAKVSSIYGAHHFLRLMYKLSQILGQLPENSNMAVALTIFKPLLDFLANNTEKYFKMSNFGFLSTEYQRRALV